MMRAVEIEQYGSPEVLTYREGVPRPDIGPDTVLVRNRASSVNPVDVKKCDGYGAPLFEKKRKRKFPWVLGADTAGVVAQIGSKVTKFAVGDEVFGASGIDGQGTWAEYSVMTEEELANKPKNLSFEEAAALPYVGLTSWAALVERANLTPDNSNGKKVLVHAGSGGVGSFAIQLLKSLGCYVATTCSERNVELVQGLGADRVVDYSKEDFARILSDYDVVLDTLGPGLAGNEAKSISILGKGKEATYVTIVHPMLSSVTDNGLLLGLAKAGISLVARKAKNKGIGYHWSVFKPNSSALAQIAGLLESQKIRPVIDSVYPLEQLQRAVEHVATGKSRGKVVITI